MPTGGRRPSRASSRAWPDAAKFLARHGGATEKAFLEEQLATTRDAGIARAIRSAIAAIDARAKAGTKP
ncbi:MAG TPA: hypothetical protein VFK02_05835 [Kofleriaceae bacterium]|nr:hypothetical protein [Kofleriaceae bacterium]